MEHPGKIDSSKRREAVFFIVYIRNYVELIIWGNKVTVALFIWVYLFILFMVLYLYFVNM